MGNRLQKIVGNVYKLPTGLRARALTGILGRVVPFVGTAGLRIEELTEARTVVSVANRRKVQNHIGGVHAAAMTLLAETVSGLVVGMNVPDDRVPVMKELSMAFKKRATGGLRAVAELTEAQRAAIRDTPKGEVNVAVRLTDDAGIEPVEAVMIWAWTPKRRDR
jgi:acyl-coenzyme A thioesterase PaaI-like protein